VQGRKKKRMIFISSNLKELLRLSEMRRGKKKPPTEFASVEKVQEYTQTSSIPSLHSARSAGITALDVNSTGTLILTGGNDKHVQVYNKSEDKVIANLAGHTKKVTAVKFRGQQEENDVFLSASADKHVRLWIPDEKKGNERAFGLLERILIQFL
jgi:pre-mRNA-processing factor 19